MPFLVMDSLVLRWQSLSPRFDQPFEGSVRSSFLSIATLCFASSLSAQNSDWSIDETEWHLAGQSVNTDYYVNIKDFLAGRPDTYAGQMWLLIDASKDPEVAWRHAKVRYLVDCPSRRFRSTTAVFYYPNGRTESHEGSYSYSYVIPGSAFESAVNAYCS